MGIGIGFNVGPLRVGRAAAPEPLTSWETVVAAIGLTTAMLVAVPVMFAVIIVLLL